MNKKKFDKTQFNKHSLRKTVLPSMPDNKNLGTEKLNGSKEKQAREPFTKRNNFEAQVHRF